MDRKNVAVIIVSLAIALFLGMNLFLRDQLFTKSFQYDTLQETISQLKAENSVLQRQIFEEESLNTIQQKAEQQGFIPASYFILK